MAAALRDQIRRAGGSLPFEEFMRFALYDPQHGYYSRRVRTVGREGDFSTSATLHPALAEAVAAWASRHRENGTARDGWWHLVELGGGTGEMAAGVLGSLGWWARRKLRYHIVEVSAGLRARQQERLASWEGRVSWHETTTGALQVAKAAALIYSNEFVDAFPCARWVFDGAAAIWREVRVAWPEEAELPLEIVGDAVADADLALASVADRAFAENWPPGQRVEVFLSYRRWQQEQLACWRRGRLLTIDYGDQMPALYQRRPGGTLRAYCRQMRFTDREIYARIGQQDLTADVNFTDLRRWGDDFALATTGYAMQAEFLNAWLPRAAVLQLARNSRLAGLVDPGGAGGAFKVLEQIRGIDHAAP